MSPDRKKQLRLTYQTTLSEEWKATLETWFKEWEAAYKALATVDATDTAAIIRHQQTIYLIERLIHAVERDCEEHRRLQRRDADD